MKTFLSGETLTAADINASLLEASNSVNSSAQYTWSNTQTFSKDMIITRAQESVTVSATAATGTVNLDVITQTILYYTTNASANFTLNVRGNNTTTLNSIMSVGQSLTIAFLNTNGATPYYNNIFSIDSTTTTVKWPYGVAPASGTASSIDTYVYTIIKTANGTYTVLGNQQTYS